MGNLTTKPDDNVNNSSISTTQSQSQNISSTSSTSNTSSTSTTETISSSQPDKENQETNVNKTKITKIPLKDYDVFDNYTKDQKVEYIKVNRPSNINIDDKLKQHVDKVILTSSDLLTLNIEVYEKYSYAIANLNLAINTTKKSYFNSSKMCFIKPTFSSDKIDQDILKKSIVDLNHVFTLDPQVATTILHPKNTININVNNITLLEFNDSFRDSNIASKDMFGISKKLLANSPDYHKQQFINIYNKLFNKTIQVASSSLGKATLVYKEAKNGPKDELASFRQIVAIHNSINHFHRILTLRLATYLDTNNYLDKTIQKGAIAGIKNGLLEHIFKLKQTIKDANKNKKKLNIIFVDISNAFGSLNLEKLYEIMKLYKIDNLFIDYIKSFYAGFEYYFQTKDWTTKLHKWGVKDGLVQGCPFSPLLFVLAINYVLTHIDSKYKDTHGYDLQSNEVDKVDKVDKEDKEDKNKEDKDKNKNKEDKEEIKSNKLLFAAFIDDIAIIANSSEHALFIFRELKRLLATIGLSLNASKCAYMVVNDEDIKEENIKEEIKVEIKVTKVTKEEEIKINQANKLPKVDTYKYLGEYISSDGTTCESYNKFISLLGKKLFSLDKKKLDINIKLKFFSKCFLPWIQRKMAAMYDMTKLEKVKIIYVIKKYINKWGNTEDVTIFNFITKSLSDSQDEVIKKMNINVNHEEFDLDIKDDIELANSCFKPGNTIDIGITYDKINKEPVIGDIIEEDKEVDKVVKEEKNKEFKKTTLDDFGIGYNNSQAVTQEVNLKDNTQAMSTQAMSTQAMSTQAMSTQSMSTQAMSTQAMPTIADVLNATQETQEMPTQAMPSIVDVLNTPIQVAPIQVAPIQVVLNTPIQVAPIQEMQTIQDIQTIQAIQATTQDITLLL
jgi:hypothetical protein